MLRGLKPLAYFVTANEGVPDCLLRYFQMFDRHVSLGRFSKHETALSTQLQDRQFKRLFYALPDEAWRVRAMTDLLAQPAGWTDEKERRFGELLGYQDWQNDYWLAQKWRPPQPGAD